MGMDMSSKRDRDKLGATKDDESGGSSGQGGKIEFRDFVTGPGSQRDDNLPPDELKRLLASHNQTHESRVKKQKELRDQRNDLKAGKVTLQDYRQGLSSGMSSQYPAHPTLKDKAQFSGVDRQNNPVPTENNAKTNEENRNELEHKYQLRHQPQLAQKFNPKPQMR
jgi:hypothetical protein